MSWKSSGYSPVDCGRAVVLVGNGLNWAGHGPSWGELLGSLKTTAKYSDELDPNTPFPLTYEELYLHAARLGSTEEDMLKEVATHAAKIPATDLVGRLAKLPVQHLLTTNYDGATRRGFLGGDGEATAPVRESRYSLFRRFEHGEKVVWPIHGTSAATNSIMLGYEHYSGYLAQVRSYVTRGVRYQEVSHPSLVKGLSPDPGKLDLIRSWVDFFFTKPVVVFGLTLDFDEIHLWWLLTYIARKRAEGKKFAAQSTVTFVCGPLAEPTGPDDHEALKRQDRQVRIRRLLLATNVQLVQVSTTDPRDRTVHYNAVLDRVEDLLRSF